MRVTGWAITPSTIFVGSRIVIKRMVSGIVAFLAGILLAPIFLCIIVWILVDDGYPVFFKQKRVGRGKSFFEIYKFRTMKKSTPNDMPTHLLENPEQYITCSGRFLRKTSLDELPQLLNIIKGELDVVGPRPALWNQTDLIKERDRYGANDIRPGLTGWAQVHGRDTISIEEKARLDGEYIKKMCFKMDVLCIVKTFFSVIKADGVAEGGVR